MTLIGATTENPYFEVNSALISRTHVYELEALTAVDIRALLDRAAARGECGDPALIDPEALEFLAERSGGDARTALNGLELACEAAGAGERVTLAHAEDALQRRALLYDRQADRHYDTISAWIKATRGSDPDASLYYLAVMLEGGEDPRFIVRRMVVLASEDIGNADPQALVVATAAAAAVEHVGLPGVPVRAGPGRDLPVAGAQVRRGQARRDRCPRPHPRARRRAAAAAPAVLDAQRSPVRQPARATRPSIPRSCCPTRRSVRASTSPTRPRPRCASDSSGSGGSGAAHERRAGVVQPGHRRADRRRRDHGAGRGRGGRPGRRQGPAVLGPADARRPGALPRAGGAGA